MSQPLQFLIFFSVILLIFGLMQFYLAVSYRRWVRDVWPDQATRFLRPVKYVIIIGSALLLMGFAARRFGSEYSPVLRYAIIYPGGLYFAATTLGFFVIAVKDILLLSIRLIGVLTRFGRRILRIPKSVPVAVTNNVNEGRRTFLRLAGAGTIGAISATPLLTSLATARDYQVRRIPLFFPNLPAELEGITIAQISDLHSGVYMSEHDMRHIFEIVNGLRPHLTVVTGDLVDTTDEEIPPLHRALKDLRADRGVYAVLGNHDHFATGSKVAAATSDAGLTVLRNEHTTLDIDGGKLSLIGIDDPSPRRNFANLPKAMDGLDPESFKVMLVHQPRFWSEAKRANMDLTLVGHTHGGQVGMDLFGLKLYPVYLAYDYPMGHFIEEGKQLYVNVGVGMVGTPIRLVRPEIDLFTLRHGTPKEFVADSV